jgi:hypothetical protein
MPRAFAIAAALGAALLLPWACGDDTTTTAATSTSTSGVGAAGGGGAGGMGGGGAPPELPEPDCDAPADPPSMGGCVVLTTGQGGGGGAGGAGGAGGGPPPPGIDCNPVTNEPCDQGADLVCDIAGSVGFKCWPTAEGAALCEDCSQGGMEFCGPGLTCVGVATCARYCCDDADCSSAGSCVKEIDGQPWFPQAPDLGLCLLP